MELIASQNIKEVLSVKGGERENYEWQTLRA